MDRLITLVPTLPKKGVWANQTVILPGVGEATFDAQGHLAVPDHQVLDLLKATEDSFGFTVLKAAAGDAPASDAPSAAETAAAETSTDQGSGEQAGSEAAPLSEAQQKELDTLSEKAAADQRIKDQLDGLDLPGLLKLAEEFPDLTKEAIALMTDAKLRLELYERLTK